VILVPCSILSQDVVNAEHSMADTTAKVITKDGWLKTGDLGLLDEDGFLYIRDRSRSFAQLHSPPLKSLHSKGLDYSWWRECRKSFTVSSFRGPTFDVSQDSVSVENALYADPRISEVAAVGVPDERLGEMVAAVVCLKPAFYEKVSEAELIAMAKQRLAV
jgi:acyl-CoA synthetase (AMP-forming)/AMP-acid ligase II